jgi:hypothetical protein
MSIRSHESADTTCGRPRSNAWRNTSSAWTTTLARVSIDAPRDPAGQIIQFHDELPPMLAVRDQSLQPLSKAAAGGD